MSEKISAATLDRLKTTRKYLHRHPELSGEEKATAKYIAEKLEKLKPDSLITGLGGHGVLAIFEGSNSGKSILLRCELDALPITEENDFEHRSKQEGVAHKCGHDGHMAILLGVAEYLSNHRPEKGSVRLLFQPAEETGAGARAVLDDKKFKDLKSPDYVFALHNVPGIEMHTIGSRAGVFTPSVISLKIHLKGRTSHAGEPDKGINPSSAVSELIQQVQELHQPDLKKSDFAIIAIAEIKVGNHNYGSSAGDGFLGLTIRSISNEKLDALKETIHALAAKTAKKHKLKYKPEWFEEFRACVNDPRCHEIVMQAAKSVEFNAVELEEPFPWGEDFGFFTEKNKGAMFALGAGKETPPMHHPGYDFPDELILTGIKMFAGIIEKILK